MKHLYYYTDIEVLCVQQADTEDMVDTGHYPWGLRLVLPDIVPNSKCL